MSAPLPALLREAGATLIDSDTSGRGFLGEALRRGDGSLVLAMPAGQDATVRDLAARYLIGRALGLDVAPLPDPLQVDVH